MVEIQTQLQVKKEEAIAKYYPQVMEKIKDFDVRLQIKQKITDLRHRIENTTIDSMIERSIWTRKKIWRFIRKVEYYMQCKSSEEARHMLNISPEIKTLGDLFAIKD